jgi:hypothetical protein
MLMPTIKRSQLIIAVVSVGLVLKENNKRKNLGQYLVPWLVPFYSYARR